MDPITLVQAALQIFFTLSKQAGKTREERDQMYDQVKAEYDALPDPHTLRDTELEE